MSLLFCFVVAIVCQTTTTTTAAAKTTTAVTSSTATTTATATTSLPSSSTVTTQATFTTTNGNGNLTDELVIPCKTSADCLWSCVNSTCVSLSLLWNANVRKYRGNIICVNTAVNARETPNGKILRLLSKGTKTGIFNTSPVIVDGFYWYELNSGQWSVFRLVNSSATLYLKVCNDVPAYVPTPPPDSSLMQGGSFCSESLSYAEGSPCHCIAEAALGIDETTCNGVSALNSSDELIGKITRVPWPYMYDRQQYVCAVGNATDLLMARLPTVSVTLPGDRITKASKLDAFACHVDADFVRVLQGNVIKFVSFSNSRWTRCCTFASTLPPTPAPAPTAIAREPYLDYVVSMYVDRTCTDHLQSYNVSTVKLPSSQQFDNPTIEPFCINGGDFSLRLLLYENRTSSTPYIRPVYGLDHIEAVACVTPACCTSNYGRRLSYDDCTEVQVSDNDVRYDQRKLLFVQLSRSYKPPKYNVDGSGRLLEPLPYYHILIDVAFSLPLLAFTLWCMKRGEHASAAYFAYYSFVIVMMPICILLDMFRTAQTFECTIIGLIFIIQVVASNLYELTQIENKKIEFGVKIGIYLASYINYIIFFAFAINDPFFYSFLWISKNLFLFGILIELSEPSSGETSSKFTKVLDKFAEVTSLAGAIFVFVYQYFGTVNSFIGVYASIGEFQSLILKYNYILICHGINGLYRGFILLINLGNIGIMIYAFVQVYNSGTWLFWVLLGFAIVGSIWGCVYAVKSEAAYTAKSD